MDRGFLRDVNEQIHERLAKHDMPGDYICECERLGCDEPWIRMSPDEFTAVLVADGCYVVAPGHEPRTAEIVWGSEGYLVVRDVREVPRGRSAEDADVLAARDDELRGVRGLTAGERKLRRRKPGQRQVDVPVSLHVRRDVDAQIRA